MPRYTATTRKFRLKVTDHKTQYRVTFPKMLKEKKNPINGSWQYNPKNGTLILEVESEVCYSTGTGIFCELCGRESWVTSEMTEEEHERAHERLRKLVEEGEIEKKELGYFHMCHCPVHGFVHEKCDGFQKECW